MIVFSSDTHRQHHSSEFYGGRLIPSWECPERMDFAVSALAGAHDICEPTEVDLGLLRAVHSEAYLDFLSTAWDRWVDAGESASTAFGFSWPARAGRTTPPSQIDGALGYYSHSVDCGITSGTWQAALGSAAIAQSATAAVLSGEPVAFGLCRPPGHHATSDQFGGYCYLNNAAIAAQQLLDAGVDRVGILDIDYHHGNGTQDIFYDRSDVLYCSIHASPEVDFPYFYGFAGETGSKAGSGFNTNYPLPHGSGFDVWSAALDDAIARMADADIDALVVSVGVDAFAQDPISQFKLETPDFAEVGRRIAAMSLPTVLIMEGGYAVEALGTNVAAVLGGFEGTSS